MIWPTAASFVIMLLRMSLPYPKSASISHCRFIHMWLTSSRCAQQRVRCYRQSRRSRPSPRQLRLREVPRTLLFRRLLALGERKRSSAVNFMMGLVWVVAKPGTNRRGIANRELYNCSENPCITNIVIYVALNTFKRVTSERVPVLRIRVQTLYQAKSLLWCNSRVDKSRYRCPSRLDGRKKVRRKWSLKYAKVCQNKDVSSTIWKESFLSVRVHACPYHVKQNEQIAY